MFHCICLHVVVGDFTSAGISYQHGMKILEGLGASGLRSMRFGLEVPGIQKIICNDFDQTATEIIDRNIQRNNLGGIVEASCGDASMLMHQNKYNFDVVDLDPYGTAAPFFDAAVMSLREGGLLCVTCTDAAILCGNTPEKCFTMYGSLPLRAKFAHESGLRVILRCLESHAARHSRYIVPLLSLSVDFYFRLFVKVYSGQKQAKRSASHSGMVYHCTGCGAYTCQPLAEATLTKGDEYKFTPFKGPPVSEHCVQCGSRHAIGGPIYLGPLHNLAFINRVLLSLDRLPHLSTERRIIGMLSMAAEELDEPFYWEMDGMCKTLHCVPPPMITLRYSSSSKHFVSIHFFWCGRKYQSLK